MDITQVRATPVRIPIMRPATFSKRQRTAVLATIVEVQTDNGLVGLGETRGHWAAPIINERFGPLLIGMPANDQNAAFDKCISSPFDYGFPERGCEVHAFAGIEIALWDLAGKAAGQPLYEMLGGPVRERAPFTAYAYTVDPAEGKGESAVPETMAALARQGVEESGANLFEFKIGVYSVECEIAAVLAIREAIGPHVGIAVDANMGWSMDNARRFLEGVADARLENFEEPVVSLANMQRLRSAFEVPFSTHCFDLDALAAYPAIDSVVSDVQPLGGIGPTLEFIRQLTVMNRRFWLRAHWEAGIYWAVMCHMGIALPQLDRPAQALMNWVSDDLILGPAWKVEDGGVCPPGGPGLGVELDREAMARYEVG